MKTTLCIILFLCCKTVSAQRAVATHTYANQIKMSPLLFVTPLHGIGFSYERLQGKFSTQITPTYFLPLEYGIRGFMLGLEEKYFITQSQTAKSYISLDATFLNTKYEIKDDFVRAFPDSVYRYRDTVTVKAASYSFGVKYGIQIYYKRVVFDFAAGLGFRYINIEHSNLLYADGTLQDTSISLKMSYISLPRKRFIPAVPISLKVGYRF